MLVLCCTRDTKADVISGDQPTDGTMAAN